MRPVFAAALLLGLMGCPTPPESGPAGGAGGPGPAGGPPPGQPGMGGPNGAGPGAGAGGPDGANAGGPPPTGAVEGGAPGEAGAPPDGAPSPDGAPAPGADGAAMGEGGPPPEGGAEGGPPAGTPPATAQPAGNASVMVFFVDTARVESGEAPFLAGVPREVGADEVIGNALKALFEGPTEAEADRGFSFEGSGATGITNFSVDNGVLSVQLTGGCDGGGATVTVADQIFRTATQFREVQTVKLRGPDGKTAQPSGPENSRPDCLEP